MLFSIFELYLWATSFLQSLLLRQTFFKVSGDHGPVFGLHLYELVFLWRLHLLALEFSHLKSRLYGYPSL